MYFVLVVIFYLLTTIIDLSVSQSTNSQYQTKCRQKTTETFHSIYPDSRKIFYLDHLHGIDWNLGSDDNVYQGIRAQVPGDILTDLQNANIISDPLYSLNFLHERKVWLGGTSDNIDSDLVEKRSRIWTYSTSFSLPISKSSLKSSGSIHHVLVFEGIKMGASIHVNGLFLGNVSDQFLRYTFPIPNSSLFEQNMTSNIPKTDDRTKSLFQRMLHKTLFDIQDYSKNIQIHLQVTFDPNMEVNGRFMACSGGWDWAPYARTRDSRGLSKVFSFGIFKPVYIVEVQASQIINVVPKITYLGDFPREPMLNGPEGDFQLDVDVYIETFSSLFPKNEVAIRASFEKEYQEIKAPLSKARKPKDTKQTESSVFVVTLSILVSKEDVKLWWPNGAGEQNLYSIHVQYRDIEQGLQTEWIERRIGFRTSALVTFNEYEGNDNSGGKEDGSGNHGMYFRINGALIWSRGANFVPMDQFEGRLKNESHRTLVESAAAANMNMIRVWGGGSIPPSSFYDACDENGILIYHDMMYVEEQYHGPHVNEWEEMEIRHIVRTLSFHPSIVLWVGCNECSVQMGTDSDIYARFVMKTVAEEDSTRAIWPSCPSSNGWKTGVFGNNSHPDGLPLTTPPIDPNETAIEKHGPYMHGASQTFQSVNGHSSDTPYDTQIPLTFERSHIGPQHPNQFISEFGGSTISSFESMSPLLDPSEWGIHGGSTHDNCTQIYLNENSCSGKNAMAERNYPCDNHIEAYFGAYDLDIKGEYQFKKQLYHCMMANTLWMKSEIERQRSTNSFGSLIWQLNENWPTGGWGVFEYSSGIGQVEGGRWKPLAHLLKRSLFRDIFATCNGKGLCFCRNDGIHDFQGVLSVETWDLLLDKRVGSTKIKIVLEGGKAAVEWFAFDMMNLQPTRNIIFISVTNRFGNYHYMGQNVVLLSNPYSLILPENPNVNFSVIENHNGEVNIILETDKTVLYLVLTTLAQGRFSDNAFTMKKGERKIIHFNFMREICSGTGRKNEINILRKSLRVEHFGSYQ